MKEKFEQTVLKINEKLADSKTVYASWDGDNGEVSFRVIIVRVAITQNDGWHLTGWDEYSKEYCIGDATITADNETLYKP
jgi:hypothetical protein